MDVVAVAVADADEAFTVAGTPAVTTGAARFVDAAEVAVVDV